MEHHLGRHTCESAPKTRPSHRHSPKKETQVAVVGGVDGVLVVTELQCEERVLTPWHVGVHLNLRTFLVQVGVAFTAQGA
ncbi:hypothetical protein E2C01_068891 [Portunus trituberculatus]|uniref:Uncharacterized protein n=1 Tax=Portunus trituberculatus TaxID=210409 RepID=A0A5B7HNM2_PORTR|nr:hypothetical protein [Portunus trituberculatus]